ncbi:MAG: SRPBCC family protein [Candidatus Kerfeldbacteria bacterium]|nr:SRPBCC family protein [Candidatus Kerfeldbacteria bacterium]
MPHTEGSITINKPVDQVFAFVADGENNGKWRSGILDVKLASERPMTVGAKYTQGMKGPGGRIPADYEIVEYIPDRKIRFQVTAGPARPEGQFDFESTNGGTHVAFSLTWEPKGLMQKWFMAPMVAKQMPKEVAALENLKKVLESA